MHDKYILKKKKNRINHHLYSRKFRPIRSIGFKHRLQRRHALEWQFNFYRLRINVLNIISQIRQSSRNALNTI